MTSDLAPVNLDESPTRMRVYLGAGLGASTQIELVLRKARGPVLRYTHEERGTASCFPSASQWQGLRRVCEEVNAFAWADEYRPPLEATDPPEWQIDIEWPDGAEVRSSGVGGFPTWPDGSPANAAFDRVMQALSATVGNRDVYGRRARRRQTPDSWSESLLRSAVRFAATRLRDDTRHQEESLDAAIAEGIQRQAPELEAFRAQVSLHGWLNPRSTTREVDLLLPGDIALEQKVEDVWQQIWDVAKLLSMLASGDIREAYIIAWAPTQTFEHKALGELYRPAGSWQLGDLIARHRSSWDACLRDGNNQPTHAPTEFSTCLVAAAAVNEGWEIRAVRLELLTGEYTDFDAHGLPLNVAKPVEQIVITKDQLIDIWIASHTTLATQWHLSRHAAYAAIYGINLDHPPTKDHPQDPRVRDTRILHKALLDAVALHNQHGSLFPGALEIPEWLADYSENEREYLSALTQERNATLRAFISRAVDTLWTLPPEVATTHQELRARGFDTHYLEPDPDW